MASLLAPLHIAVLAAKAIVLQPRDISSREIAIWQAAFLPCALPTAHLYAASQTIDVLQAVGFDVVTSSVECCGMAGSLG
jgi:hypothetical protein